MQPMFTGRFSLTAITALLVLCASCTKPLPPPEAPKVDDPNKIDPDRLLEQMTFPYDKFGWVETILAYRPLEPGEEGAKAKERLKAAAAFVDKRLGKYRVMRRVMVHKKWVTIGLGSVNKARLQRIQEILDDEHTLGVFRVDSSAPFQGKLKDLADARSVHLRRDKAGDEFLWSSALPALEQRVDRIPEEIGMPDNRRMAIAAHAEATVYGFRSYLLEVPPWLTVTDLQSAESVIDVRPNIEQVLKKPPVVHLNFKEEAALRLARLSGKHKGQQVAILLSGRVQAVVTVEARIRTGTLVLTLGTERTYPELVDMAQVLARQLNTQAGMPRLQMDGIYGSAPGYQ